jgi:thiamine biosynthesis lipoprotein
MNKLFSIGLVFLIALGSGCRRDQAPALNTRVADYPARVEVDVRQAQQLNEISGLAIALMSDTLSDLDPARPGSDINKLNRVASTVRLQVSRSTFRLLDLAHHYAELTGGALDFTAAPLEKIWGLHGQIPEEIPSAALIEGTQAGVGHLFVEIFDKGAVAFTSPNTQIDLGPLGAAYAVDLATLDLRQRGFNTVRLQLGGIQRVLGRPHEQQAWSALLPAPSATLTNLGTVRLDHPHTALAVVQLYDPPLLIANTLFGHVLDPRNGRPAKGTLLTAVLAPSATLAQALAQALLVVGLDDAPALLPLFPKCEVLMIPDRQPEELWMTRDFAERFSADPSFTGTFQTLEPQIVTPAASDEAAPSAPPR